jgi:enoyl-CoA hydratase/carnithine racemase
MQDRVKLEYRDGVAYVTLNRGDKFNGLDLDMLEALVSTARAIRRERSVRAVILRGDGPAFCAGLDFGSVSKQPLRMFRAFLKYGVKATNLFQEACWCWRELPVPVLVVLHGRCYGGGMQIALAADFRFSTPDCELSILEAKWGLVPDMSGTVTLRELVPMDLAKRLTMTGEMFSGTQAKAWNLVTEVADDPLAAAEALVAQLKTRSPDAVAGTKALFQQTWGASENAALDIESRIQRKLILGKNHKIARTANFRKVVPQFVDRTFEE